MKRHTTISNNLQEHQINSQIVQNNRPFAISRSGNKIFKKSVTNNWKKNEVLKYVTFISANSQQLDQNSIEEMWNTYKVMSSFVGSRNYRQCKMFHENLKRKIGKIDKIIEHICQTNSIECEMIKVEDIQYKRFMRERQYQKESIYKNNVFKTAVGYQQEEDQKNEIRKQEDREDINIQRINDDGKRYSLYDWIKRMNILVQKG